MSYSSLVGHRSMIFDDQRNSLYANAISQVVNADSIVLDLGAGLGLHGLMAALAGAEKVYLVEPQVEPDIASRVTSQMGLSGKIECIKGTIEEAQIPEPVDVIVSVFTGNFLLEEDLLPSSDICER